MSVQISTGPVFMDSTDFQRTDTNITWGIKLRDFGGTQVVFTVVKQPDGTWAPMETLDDGFDVNIKTYASALEYVKKHILPRLNAWLKSYFGKSGAVPTLSLFEQADKIIFGLKINRNVEGYLEASV